MRYRDRLWERALDQYGFVSTADADDLGIPKVELPKLHKRGMLAREGHGLYRFPQLPADENAPYMRAVLWTGAHHTYLSHETALAVRDVCDINPTKIHLTVPLRRRVRRAAGEDYVLHHADLDPAKTGWWENIPAVTLPTAIAQCIEYGTPAYLLRQALERGGETNLLTPAETTALTARLETVRG